MSARKVLILSSSKKSSFTEYDVFGNSYGPEGSLELNGEPVSFPAATSPLLLQLSHIASACNDSKVVYDGDLDTYTRLGEPTEAALFSLVEKLGTEDEKFNDSLPDIPDSAALAKLTAKQRKNRCAKVNDYIANIHNRTHLLEFSRDRKSMSVIVEQSAKNGKTRAKSTKSYLYCKGAPETVLERCTHYKTSADAEKAIPLTASIRNSILAKVTEWGNDMSLRVLAFASLEQPDVPEKLEQSDFVNIESGMTFIGLVGMVDPPRAEVFDAIKRCRDAGIRVIVITGDNKNTAENICRQIGVFEKQENLDGKSYTGREFDVMSPSEKLEVVLRANLFARTEPAHKSELVDLLKKQGFIVAMVCSILLRNCLTKHYRLVMELTMHLLSKKQILVFLWEVVLMLQSLLLIWC
jgi:Ca2+ transporting ATPase